MGQRSGSRYPGSPGRGPVVAVLDTTAFLAGFQLQAWGSTTLYTTSKVLEEVRDRDSRERLEVALSLGRVRVADPSRHSVGRVLSIAARIGENSLSETDVSVAALALDLAAEGLDVVVLTDDYALQNLLSHLGIEFRPLRTMGIRRRMRYIVVCPACGYRGRPWETACPRCGTRLVKRRAAVGERL